MALNANPFHPNTGELLPGYRDAYLRGDLSTKNTDLVDDYLKANRAQGTKAFERFHILQQKGHAVRPVGWLQQQFQLIRTEPARFRQRAGSLVLVAALLSGAAFAANHKASTPESEPLASSRAMPAASALAPESELSANRLTTVSGRILDENGRPLIGATILDKHNGRGVSTDATGKYTIAVPTNQVLSLQYAYGGYSEEDVQVHGHGVQNITLLPRTDQVKKHWWQFSKP
ncbi:MAG: hypothetical protein EOO62_19215 [Hymenobacter sp.]|nr:MAG: hypothetical protein EOO62_19215 [Hymenobacter sp.]